MFDKDSQFSPILLFNKQKQENICHFFLWFQHIFSRISFPPANNHHLVFPPHISVTITLHVVFIPPLNKKSYLLVTPHCEYLDEVNPQSVFQRPRRKTKALNVGKKSERINHYVGWKVNISWDYCTGGILTAAVIKRFMFSSRLFRSRLLFWYIGGSAAALSHRRC